MKNPVGAIKNAISRIDTPVLTQEMRIRQRGIRPFMVMFAYVAVLSGIAVIYLGLYGGLASSGAQNSQAVPQASAVQSPMIQTAVLATLGRRMFLILSIAQLAMIALIVPAYGSGTVTSEKERGTFDLLALTMLPSASVITQKGAAAIAQALMLTLASTPVVAVVFLLGGVSPIEVTLVYLVLVLTAGALGMLGVLCSSFLKNTRSSTFATYLISLLFLGGLPLAGMWFQQLTHMGLTGVAESAFPLMFTLMWAFATGVIALMLFGIVALVLRRTTEHWHSRSFRMAAFGGVHALLLLALSTPVTTDALMSVLYREGMFLPMFVNPFVAIYSLVGGGFDPTLGVHPSPYSPGPSSYYLGSGGVDLTGWIVGATVVFSAGCCYLFRQLSTLRFEAMRRTI